MFQGPTCIPTTQVTADLPGIGGRIKQHPDDFEVDEIPAYQPSGEGDHLFLRIEKRGVSAEQLIRHVAEALAIEPHEVGCAGLKDRHALTRQYLSVPRTVESRVSSLDTSDIKVLSATPHSNKLRTGHVHGNRFRIVVRDVVPDAAARAAAIARRVSQSGVPNYFGPQRFGIDGETAKLGMRLLADDSFRLPGPTSRHRFLRKLAIGAAQGVLFNACLDQRVRDGLIRRVLDGDAMFKLSGGIFYVTDQSVEQARFDRRETVHAGPLFGKKMFAAHGAAAEREAEIQRAFGVTRDRLHAFGKLLSGGRRANVLYASEFESRAGPDGIEFRFSLPAGGYATVLLDEFMKVTSGRDDCGIEPTTRNCS